MVALLVRLAVTDTVPRVGMTVTSFFVDCLVPV